MSIGEWLPHPLLHATLPFLELSLAALNPTFESSGSISRTVMLMAASRGCEAQQLH